MVTSFQFGLIPPIYFGPGSAVKLPDLVRSYGSSVLIVTGRSSFLSTETAMNLFDRLKSESMNFEILNVTREPAPEDIDDAVRRFKGLDFDVVLGIGGGSTLDAGKAVSAMLGKNESITDFLEVVGFRDHPGTKIPFIAVPTTSGTGSEATKNAVISKVGEGGFKRSLRHNNFVPDIAVVDPLLTINCPKDISAASGMDCFTQLLEAYISVKASAYTDALAIEGLKAVGSSLLRVVNDGNDIDARTGMSFAALTSGICIANAGLGVVHGFASSVGGRYNIPHGVVCGTLVGAANSVIVRALKNSGRHSFYLEKYVKLGKLFLKVEGKSDEYYIDGFLDYLNRITSELGLPGLKSAGVQPETLELLCSETDCKNNPVKLGKEELHEILSLRFF